MWKPLADQPAGWQYVPSELAGTKKKNTDCKCNCSGAAAGTHTQPEMLAPEKRPGSLGGIRIQKTRIRDFGAGGSEGQDPAPDPVPAPPKVRNRIRSRCRRLRGARIRR
uniref:Uncharacterized protein n=1 Tax=Panagrellus redivivus TaxID=6233 RepID=A0A7E4VEL4_PANRE